MRHLIGVLALVAAGAAANAEAAHYRFQTLLDSDQSALTGCASTTPVGTAHGKEIRILVDTDRAQIQQLVYETCESGQWREIASNNDPHALELGQGRLGSDVIEWSIDRALLGESPLIEMQLSAQNSDSAAYDLLGRGDQFDSVQIPAGLPFIPIPLGGAPAIGLLCFALAVTARRRLGGRFHRAAFLAVTSIVGGILLCASIGNSRAALDELPTEADLLEVQDRANDSVGADAGVDIVALAVRSSAERLSFRVAVNNIEDDGLIDNARVLFIGNSLTFANNLPAMLGAVAAQAGKHLVTAEVTEGGFSLQDHFQVGNAQREIAHGYQLVVLQQGPSALEESQANLLRWAGRFDPLIRASGARPALYMVWPERARFAVFDDVRASYSNAALAIDGMFVPGGEAWRASWQIDPSLQLYGSDDFHPSTLGTYTIALSLFSELYRQTPVDLPATLTLANDQVLNFDPAAARAVQQGAWQAHLQYGRAGH